MGIDPGDAIRPGLERDVVLFEQLPRQSESGKGIAPRFGSGPPGGDQTGAQAIAEMGGCRIGGVLAPAGPGGVEGIDQSGFVEAEQRTEMDAPESGLGMDGPRGGKPARASATGEAHEQGLGYVVAMVARKERGDAAAAELRIEKTRTRGPGLRLGGRGWSLFPAGGCQLHPQSPAQGGAKTRIGARGPTAQTMVEMQGEQPQAALRPMRPEEKKQGDGIGPAGKGHRPARDGT